MLISVAADLTIFADVNQNRLFVVSTVRVVGLILAQWCLGCMHGMYVVCFASVSIVDFAYAELDSHIYKSHATFLSWSMLSVASQRLIVSRHSVIEYKGQKLGDRVDDHLASDAQGDDRGRQQ